MMVVLGMSMFLMAALGLAIDGSHLYVQRQLAQAAADAGAQAGILSIYSHTNIAGAHAFAIGTGAPYTYNCAANDAATPCYYTQTLNGFNTGSDTVTYVANPPGVNPGSLSPTYPVNLLRVTVTRNVPATLTGLLGLSSFPVRASAVAAIVYVDSPVPIIVTHPTLSGSFNVGGSGSTDKIKICGGPPISIQVNSSNATALTWSGNPVVNLSQAGPPDPGNCTTGTGGSFGVTGGPASGSSIMSLGSTGFFIDPFPAIPDPLAGVSPPPDPTTASPAGPLNPAYLPAAVPAGTKGCPAAGPDCDLYFPGKYTGAWDPLESTCRHASLSIL